MKIKYLLITIFIFLLSSCSFIDKNSEKTDPIEHPSLILENSKYKVNLSTDLTIEFNSSLINIYNKTDSTTIKNVSFSIKDKEGNIVANGSCDEIDVQTKSKNLKLIGNVNINIKDPQIDIKCDKMNWNNKESSLNTDEEVKVESEYGSFIGIGFSANLETRYFEFKEIEKGALYEKDI